MLCKLILLISVCYAASETDKCDEVTTAMEAKSVLVSACAEREGKVYWVLETKMYYTHAAFACTTYTGGNAVSIHSLEEYEVLFDLAGFNETTRLWESSDNAWIGLVREENNCSLPFEWADGSKVDYENWNLGEPNCEFGIEQCTELASWGGTLEPKKGWNDLPCSGAREQRTVCSARK